METKRRICNKRGGDAAMLVGWTDRQRKGGEGGDIEAGGEVKLRGCLQAAVKAI